MLEYIAKPLKTAKRLGLLDASWMRANGFDIQDHAFEFFFVEPHYFDWPTSVHFDPKMYVQHNHDVADYPFHPLIHYINNGLADGRVIFSEDEITIPATDISHALESGLIDMAWLSLRMPELADPSDLAFLLRLEKYQYLPLSQSFDPVAYHERHPDLMDQRLHPSIHYLRSGQAEGRAAFAVFDPISILQDMPKNALWIESHELSLTGAPLALRDLLAGSGALSRSAVVAAPDDGALWGDFTGLGLKPLTHGQSWLRIHTMDQFQAMVARCKELLTIAASKSVLVNSFASFAMAEAAAQLGLPYAWVIHEPNPDEIAAVLPKDVFDIAAKRLLESPCTIFVSDDSRRAWGTNEAAHMVPKALPPQKPRDAAPGRKTAECNENDLLVLSVGTFSARKGQGDLVSALELLAKEAKNIVTVFVGYEDTPYAQDLAKRINHLQSQGVRIKLFDQSRTPKDREMVLDLFAAADLFVMTSRAESRPLTVSEAFATQTPVIATDVAGIKEMIDPGKTGFLYSPKDIKALAALLQDYMNDPQLCATQRNAIAAAQDAGAYPYMIKAFEDILLPVLNA